MKWTKEQQERFEKFILGDDMDFYEEYTIHLTDKELEKYAKNIYIKIYIMELWKWVANSYATKNKQNLESSNSFSIC